MIEYYYFHCEKDKAAYTAKMVNIEIYTSRLCGYCSRAKHLLAQKGVSYREIDVGAQPDQRAIMVERANGGYTVPQIFIDGEHIGGCDELYALERQGKLDEKLF